MKKSKIKVLYIAGVERSGSTIFNRVLGQIEGFVAWGELRDIWEHGVAENNNCTCGNSFIDCDTWQQIFSEAFGGIDTLDTFQLQELQRKTRSMVLPHYFGIFKDAFFKQKVNQYLINLEKLYKAIQLTTDSKVIVDSSKASWYGYVLSLLPFVELYVVHLVRNPKGMCYSLERRKQKGEPECQWYNPIHASLSWSFKNYSVEMLLNSSKNNYRRVCYESFIQNPQMTIDKILDFVQEKNTNTPFLDASTVKMSTDHIISGSPSSRSESGMVKLSLDDKWKQLMNPMDKILISSITFPLLKKYY